MAVREGTLEKEADFKGSFVDSLKKLRPSFSGAVEARERRRKNDEKKVEIRSEGGEAGNDGGRGQGKKEGCRG